MGRDRGNGVLTIDRSTGKLSVSWEYRLEPGALCRRGTIRHRRGQRDGRLVAFNPRWQRLRHPGSCTTWAAVTADDAGNGVTDAGGEVFGYPGLYVLDGGALPAATGVNPSRIPSPPSPSATSRPQFAS